MLIFFIPPDARSFSIIITFFAHASIFSMIISNKYTSTYIVNNNKKKEAKQKRGIFFGPGADKYVIIRGVAMMHYYY